MVSELLAANLCTPFLLKMVEGKLLPSCKSVAKPPGFFDAAGYEKNSETEAAVGLWTGNLVSVFFITQFFTSLLWSSIADRHGRRAVMVASMAVRVKLTRATSADEQGSAIALIIFGTSESVRNILQIFGLR
jgi:MFS family permease